MVQLGLCYSYVLRGGPGYPRDRPQSARRLALLLKPRTSDSLLRVDRSHDREKLRMVSSDHHSWICLTVAMTTSDGAHGEISLVFR